MPQAIYGSSDPIRSPNVTTPRVATLDSLSNLLSGSLVDLIHQAESTSLPDPIETGPSEGAHSAAVVNLPNDADTHIAIINALAQPAEASAPPYEAPEPSAPPAEQAPQATHRLFVQDLEPSAPPADQAPETTDRLFVQDLEPTAPPPREEQLADQFMAAVFQNARPTDHFLNGTNLQLERTLERQIKYPERFLSRYEGLFDTKEQLVEFLTFMQDRLSDLAHERTASEGNAPRGLSFSEMQEAVKQLSVEFAHRESEAASPTVDQDSVSEKTVTMDMFGDLEDEEVVHPEPLPSYEQAVLDISDDRDRALLQQEMGQIEVQNRNIAFFSFLNGNEQKAMDAIFNYAFANVTTDDQYVLEGDENLNLRKLEELKAKISDDPNSGFHFSEFGCQTKDQAIRLIDCFKNCFENYIETKRRNFVTDLANEERQLELQGLPIQRERPIFQGIRLSELKTVACDYIERLKQGKPEYYRETIGLPTVDEAERMRARADAEGFRRDDVFTYQQTEEAFKAYVHQIKVKYGLTEDVIPMLSTQDRQNIDPAKDVEDLLDPLQIDLYSDYEASRLAREFIQKILDELREKWLKDEKKAQEVQRKSDINKREWERKRELRERKTPKRSF